MLTCAAVQVAEGHPVFVESNAEQRLKWQTLWPNIQLTQMSTTNYVCEPTSYTDAIKAGGYEAAIIPGPDWSAVKADGSACGIQTIGTTCTLHLYCPLIQ